MALYLVRHGESIPKEINPHSPLSDRGLVEVARVATQAAKKNFIITKIFHSGKKRAEQTAIIMKDYINPAFGIAQSVRIDPNDDIFYALDLIEQTENIMIVGHLPFLEKLVSHLVTGDQETEVMKFPTAGMVCLDKDSKGKWNIKWKLFP